MGESQEAEENGEKVEKTLVNLRVPVEMKKEWEDYLEETGEFTAVSQLIRTAVKKEMNSDNMSTSASPAIEPDIADMKETINEMQADLQTLVSDHYESEGIQDIATQVRDELVPLPKPTGPVEMPESVDMDEREYRRQMAAEAIVMPDDQEQFEAEGDNNQTAAAIAQRVDSTSEQVEKAIDTLQDDFLPVVEVEIDDEVHYFMEQ